MGGLWSSSSRRAALALALLGALAALAGCGESGEDGAEQLAKQQELRAAREEAARDARQGVRIAELERRLRGASKRATDSGAGGNAGGGSGGTDVGPGGGPVDGGEPLSGIWKGEAVIDYESGESDPFNQTIEIDSLVPGAVSGYSEARQGSTTCHGPLTYVGVSEGWYRFEGSERNVAECIDYSEVELMPTAGGLAYRETTDVSVSSGTLQRAGS